MVYPKQVSADAGYSSEENHELCRDEFDIQSLMPSTNGRPTDKEPSGRYRRAMKRYLHLSNDGQRWQVETGFSIESNGVWGRRCVPERSRCSGSYCCSKR